MAVTIGNIYNDLASDRSRRVAVTAGSSLADVIAGIETVLMTAPGGWSIHDAAAGASAKCYKALQKDGTSYTYMVLDWSTVISAGVAGLIVRLYEDWSAATHTGTNKAVNTRNRTNQTVAEHLLSGQRLPFGENDPWQIDVHVLPGGAAFFASRETAQAASNVAFSGSPTYGGVTAVAECLRENANTLPPGVPAGVWFNSGQMVNATVSWFYYATSLCRIFDGRNGDGAGAVYPGLCCVDQHNVGGYVSATNRRIAGIGGLVYVSRYVVTAVGQTFPAAASDYADIGAIRGVACVGQGNAHNSVWEVACDSDYLPSPGGTNRKMRCYVGSGGPMCLLLPL